MPNPQMLIGVYNMKLGFDNEKYLSEQSEEIRRRAERFGKLYLEFGGRTDKIDGIVNELETDLKNRLLASLDGLGLGALAGLVR